MWKENLYQPVEVFTRRHTTFPINEHQHSFFEMVYVYSGSGTFYVKEEEYKVQQTEYKSRALFLIPPDTVHRFTINSECEYIFIRFTPHYAADYLGKHIERALYASRQKCEMELDERNLETVRSLFGHIEQEVACPRKYSNYILQQWLNSILVITAGCLLHDSTDDNAIMLKPDKAVYMLQYIQQHIHQPELLKTKALCNTFNLAPSYVGIFFKRNFQEDLQHYIVRNRLKMVENLLINTTMSIKEIAAKMNYTDSCYLVKAFRAVYGLSPLEYRKEKVGSQIAG